MYLITCVDEKWGIGKNNKLLFHIPKDMKFFKDITKNNIVVMGYNTFKSLPKIGLDYRENIVITNRKISLPKHKNIKFTSDIDYVLDIQKTSKGKKIFIIGGEKIYNLFLPYCKIAYVTKVFDITKNADTFFPNLDKNENWQIKNKSAIHTFKNSLKYQFITYNLK